MVKSKHDTVEIISFAKTLFFILPVYKTTIFIDYTIDSSLVQSHGLYLVLLKCILIVSS